MRDHERLRAFELADQLALLAYQVTSAFPKAEMYGMVSQMRRAVVSVPCNIVEGCARTTQPEYLRFLEIAFASLQELAYQASLAHRLGFLPLKDFQVFNDACTETNRVLSALMRSLHRKAPLTPYPLNP